MQNISRTERLLSQTSKYELYGKVPEVTFLFWVIKIAATTLGETGGDMVTMSMNLGYLTGSLIFAALFIILVSFQVRAKSFHPFLFWLVIIATTTFGTTLADLCDRSLGIGYLGGSTILFIALMLSLVVWYRSTGSLSMSNLSTVKAEVFYWITVMFSQTLGTALGDWVADPKTGLGQGYGGGALLFGAALLIVLGLYVWTKISHTALFWAAFILTRPLGATVGDFFDKPHSAGGLDVSRYTASAILAAFIIICLVLFRQRPEKVRSGG